METVPIILVGTKLDLRTERTELSLMASQGQQPVQTAEGEQVAREIGAKRYLECSAKTRFGVQEVFDAALKETFSKGALLDGWKANNGPASSTRKRKCVLL
jgi:Rho family protein